jgi:2-hydroxychromene-2-carboxylate isomerase
MRKPAIPRFYFSLRSPYSWLAYVDLHRQYADIAPMLELRPFWEPDARSQVMLADAGGRFVYTPMSKEKHLYILQDIRRLAAERGLEVGWPIDREPCWEVPHLAYLAARRHGKDQDYIALAYQMRWQEGRDICDPETIAELAGKLGLDEAELAGAHENEELRREGLGALLDMHHDDVFGVPLFVDRRTRYWGLDRLAVFASAVRSGGTPQVPPLEEIRQQDQAAAEADARASDFGPAGGCG